MRLQPCDDGAAVAIHRNTVIYRLDKISRLTARDVREPQVAIAAYLACLIDE